MVRLVRVDDHNASAEDIALYVSVVDIANRLGVDPFMSEEAERLFDDLLAGYRGSLDNLASWLEREITRAFAAIGRRPRWLQSADWPFAHGQPMVFVGQMDLAVTNSDLLSQLYHDDTSLFVFVSPKAPPQVVVQQM